MKLQYFSRGDSLEKNQMLGKIEDKKRNYSMDMDLSKLQETVEDRGAWYATVHEVTKNHT